MDIWLRTILVVVVYSAAIWWTNQFLPVTHAALRLALSFVIVQGAAIALMLIALLTRRGIAERRARRSYRIAALAHAAVAEHAAGMDRLRVLRELQHESRRDVGSAVGSFVRATRGTMQSRVQALARDLGITEAESEAGGTIALAAEGSLLERALIADALLVRADEIVQHEIPPALLSPDASQAAAALDLLRAWKRVFAVRGIDYALLRKEDDVRARAFQVLPYVQPSHEPLLEGGLHDPSPRVRAAAAEAAGKMRVTSAIPLLEAALNDTNVDVVHAAAFALALMPDGMTALQRHAENRTAFEALEKAMLGRAEVA